MDPEISMMTMKEPTSTEVSDFDEQHAKSCKTYGSMKLLMVNPTWIQDHIDTSIKHAFKCTAYIKKSHPKANLPSQGTIESMGYDFTNIHGTTIEPHSTNRIRTGLMCTSPKGTYIRIAPRSRLATKGITVQGGVIDPDYRGEIEVILHNSTSEAYNIAPAQKIAQFIFEQAHTPMIVLTEKLDTTTRANKGFGSTGRRHRKRGIFHITPTDSIWYDNTKSKKPKAKRINRPITVGIQNPLVQLTNRQQQNLETSVNMHETKSTQTPQKKDQQSLRQQPAYTVNMSEPKHLHMSHDHLLQSIGFLKPKKLLKHINEISDGTTTFSEMPRQPKLDPGEVATMPSKKRNTKPSPPPKEYSDIWHMDIGFGPCTAIGGARYALLLIDKHSRYKRVYPLKDLKDSLLKAIKLFYKDAKVLPKCIRTDFDPKLIRSKVAEYIEQEMKTELQAAPPKRQHQNGLVERAWQTIVVQTRNWLTSQLLPSEFWYHGVKRAVEVGNILPTSHIKTKITTPFEIVYGKKVDYRQLFPMFSCAYIKQETEQGGRHKSKFKSQSLKCIIVGKDTKSDGFIFITLPPNKH